jgi:disulfide bond formation protein DsbB
MITRETVHPSRDAQEAQRFARVRPYLWLSWIVSLAALGGSLYFSEVRHLPPCVLCWYQRILMYPLAVLIPIGILKKDTNLPLYVLALSVPGTLVAIYHALLQYGIIPDSLAPCQAGISCTTQQILWFGFITIPLLSAMAFALLSVAMLRIRSLQKNAQ